MLGDSWLVKARFYTNLLLIYAITALFLWYIWHPVTLLGFGKPNASNSAIAIPKPPKLEPRVITGKPMRIVIPKYNIDLLVREGNYNPSDQTWFLSGYDAQYATPSIPPNDTQGNTLIYGHNNKYVFGPLNKKTPAVNDVAEVITDNGHAFIYIFEAAEDVKPDHMTVFQYNGPPSLIVQTCSGNWNEWRRLYRFKFERVE